MIMADTDLCSGDAAPRVCVVGDCVRPRFIIDAVREGFHAVAEL